MLCPKCNGVTMVCDTRYNAKENEMFRQRTCKVCSHKFFTIEFDIEANNKFTMLWKTLIRGSGKKQ